MVRELSFSTSIPGCDTRAFYEIACAPSEPVRAFHLSVDPDDDVVVSGWDETGTRSVCFTLSMAVPPTVQRFIGAGPIRIKEKQTLTWLEGDVIQIVSVPVVQISVAKSLSTRATLRIVPCDGGCSVDVSVSVSASVPWPMQGTIETLMADQAAKTVGRYVDFVRGYVEEELTRRNNAAAAAEEGGVVGVEQQATAGEAGAQPAVVAVAAAPTTPPADAGAPKVVPVAPCSTALVADTRAPARPPLQHLTLLVPSPSAEEDVFYDAQELQLMPGAAASEQLATALLRELQAAQAARAEANRLLSDIRSSVQALEACVSREIGFNEGLRYAAAQRRSTAALMLAAASGAAATAAATALLLSRRQRAG